MVLSKECFSHNKVIVNCSAVLLVSVHWTVTEREEERQMIVAATGSEVTEKAEQAAGWRLRFTDTFTWRI